MREYTDFILSIGGQDIEFRHVAKSVRDFLELTEEIIFDYYESQCVRKSDISAVRLDPRPFFADYAVYQVTSVCPLPVHGFIQTLDPYERERILDAYYIEHGGNEEVI